MAVANETDLEVAREEVAANAQNCVKLEELRSASKPSNGQCVVVGGACVPAQALCNFAEQLNQGKVAAPKETPEDDRIVLLRALAAEAIGTGLIVLFGCGSVCATLSGAYSGVWQVAAVWGLGVSLAIYCTAEASGAHLNPAVTLAFLLVRPQAHGMTVVKSLLYVVAQMVGAILDDRPDVNSAIQSNGTFIRDQSFYSTHSRVMRTKLEPIMPKNVYSTARTHGRRSREALSLHPSANVDCSTTEVATSSASELEVSRKGKKSRRRKTKGLFRSSAVYPGEEGLSLGLDPPVRGREAHSADSQHPTTKSPAHAAWGLAPSASEREFLRRPASHGSEDSRLHSAAQILLPSSSQRSFVADPCHEVLGDSQSMISSGELESTAAPDPHVPDGPLKGILGDISLNKPLGTEILPDNSPVVSTLGDKYEIR